MGYLRDSVAVGEWYVAETYNVYERTAGDPCPDGDHPICHDTFICEVDDLLLDPEGTARQIAADHNTILNARWIE